MSSDSLVENLDLSVSSIDHSWEFTIFIHKLILSTLILFDDTGHSVIFSISVLDELGEIGVITGKLGVPGMGVGDLLSESSILGILFSELESKGILVQF